jgi:hypothetical protein
MRWCKHSIQIVRVQGSDPDQQTAFLHLLVTQVKESIPLEAMILAGTVFVIHISTVMSNIQFNVNYNLQYTSQYSPDLSLPWHNCTG